MVNVAVTNKSSSLYFVFLSSAVFVLIKYTPTDRTSLYCSSEYLITFEMGDVQFVGPTAFCTLTGLGFLELSVVIYLLSSHMYECNAIDR